MGLAVGLLQTGAQIQILCCRVIPALSQVQGPFDQLILLSCQLGGILEQESLLLLECLDLQPQMQI